MSPYDDAAETGWYIYAITDAVAANATASLAGIDQVPVRVVVAGDLAAVAAPLELARFRAAQAELAAADLADDGWLAGALRAHERVVEQIFARVHVLPVRFGTLVPDRAGVIELLTSRAAGLRLALGRIGDAAQWSVTVTAETRHGDDDAADAPDHSVATDGTTWMLRRRDAALAVQAARERRVRAADDVRRILSRHAAGIADSQRGRTFYLVRRTNERKFAQAVRELRDGPARDGLRLEVDGPRPPYHFAGGVDSHG